MRSQVYSAGGWAVLMKRASVFLALQGNIRTTRNSEYHLAPCRSFRRIFIDLYVLRVILRLNLPHSAEKPVIDDHCSSEQMRTVECGLTDSRSFLSRRLLTKRSVAPARSSREWKNATKADGASRKKGTRKKKFDPSYNRRSSHWSRLTKDLRRACRKAKYRSGWLSLETRRSATTAGKIRT